MSDLQVGEMTRVAPPRHSVIPAMLLAGIHLQLFILSHS
jgi:hypothetical protein